MKKNIKDILNIILVLFLVFTIYKCNQKKVETITVEVPSKSGYFSTLDILNTPIKIDTIEKKSIEYKDSIIYIENNKLNDSLLNKYKNLENEYEKLKLFTDAITYNNFEKTFEDKYLYANITGKAQGKIKSLDFEYTIKPIKIDVDIPKNLEFYGLIEAGLPTDSIANFIAKGTFMMKTKNDILYTLGLDSDYRIYVGTGIKF